jgi:hypothetical protein
VKQGIRTLIGTLSGVVLIAALSLAPAVAAPTLEGHWEFVAAESGDIATAIDAAVAKMNFVKRPIARSRLKKTNPAYRTIALTRRPIRSSSSSTQASRCRCLRTGLP